MNRADHSATGDLPTPSVKFNFALNSMSRDFTSRDFMNPRELQQHQPIIPTELLSNLL